VTTSVDVAGHPAAEGSRRWGRRLWPSRLILLLILGVYFVILLSVGGPSQWGYLGVAGAPVSFWDLHSLTGAWECTRRGVDVVLVDPCDPGRPYNLPRIWLLLAFLGLGPGSTVVLGIILAAVFLAVAVIVLPASSRPSEAVFYGLVLCSPSVMLGVERGNVDILLFVMVVIAVLLFRRSERARILAHALILLAAMLKLYPIFAAGTLLRQQARRALIGFGAVVGTFLVYAFVIRSDIRTIERITPQLNAFSYGFRMFAEWLNGEGRSILGDHSYRAWEDGVTALIIAATLLGRLGRLGRLGHATRASSPAARRDLDLFVAGAGIYVSTYYLIRSFDYRLAFLLLTIPQLLRWARERRPLALVTLTALFASMWLDYLMTDGIPDLGNWLADWNRLFTFAPYNQPLALAVIAQLILYAGLLGCLVTTAADGLRRPIAPSRTPRSERGPDSRPHPHRHDPRHRRRRPPRAGSRPL